MDTNLVTQAALAGSQSKLDAFEGLYFPRTLQTSTINSETLAAHENGAYTTEHGLTAFVSEYTDSAYEFVGDHVIHAGTFFIPGILLKIQPDQLSYSFARTEGGNTQSILIRNTSARHVTITKLELRGSSAFTLVTSAPLTVIGTQQVVVRYNPTTTNPPGITNLYSTLLITTTDPEPSLPTPSGTFPTVILAVRLVGA